MIIVRHEGATRTVELLDALAPLVGSGESLSGLAAEYKRLRDTLEDDSVDILEAMQFMRGDLAKRTWPFGGSSAQELFARLLEVTRSRQPAHEVWKRLGGDEDPFPANLPERFQAFAALCKAENNSAEQAMNDFEILRDSDDGRAFDERVNEFVSLRAMLEADSGDDGIRLYQWMYQDLPADERGPYLRVQARTLSSGEASVAWERMRRTDEHGVDSQKPQALSPSQLSERVGILERYIERGAPIAVEVLRTLLAQRRPGETLAQAAQSLDTRLAALHPDYAHRAGSSDLSEALKAFTFGRENVAAAKEDQFIRVLRLAQSSEAAEGLWEALQQTGSPASLGSRIDAVAASGDVAGTVARLENVAKAMPEDVDPDRAAVALIQAEGAYAKGASQAVSHAGELEGDPTSNLEAVAHLVMASSDASTFKDAWDVVAEPGARGTPLERIQLVGTLLQALPPPQPPPRDDDFEKQDDAELEDVRQAGVENVLELVRQLQDVSADEFSGAAAQASALMQATGGHAAEAAGGLLRLLVQRNLGRFPGIPLGQLFERFATVYVTGASVDEAVRAAERDATGGPGTIERGDGEVVIGGVHVQTRTGD